VEREEHGMGSVHGKCQIVRMLYDHQCVIDDVDQVEDDKRDAFDRNWLHVEDDKDGKI
jgi:hypothetical protein